MKRKVLVGRGFLIENYLVPLASYSEITSVKYVLY